MFLSYSDQGSILLTFGMRSTKGSNFSMVLRDLLPPMAVSFLRRSRARLTKRRYLTYADAARDCKGRGYEQDEINDVVVEKTKRYRETLRCIAPLQLDASTAYALCSLLPVAGLPEINVIDFGGAAGAHYFLARALVPASCRLKWMVVETPGMAARANCVFADDELQFASDLRQAGSAMGHIDLVFTSGAIQCVENPQQYLDAILALRADYLALHRLGLSRLAHDVITIHEAKLGDHGPGPVLNGIADKSVRHPFTAIPEASFYADLRDRYDVLMTFDDRSGTIFLHDDSVVGLGIVAKRRDDFRGSGPATSDATVIP